MLGIAGASEKGAGLQRIRLALVQKWYGAWRRVLKRTYYVACRIRGSNPSSARRRNGERWAEVEFFVEAWEIRDANCGGGTVYQVWDGVNATDLASGGKITNWSLRHWLMLKLIMVSV